MFNLNLASVPVGPGDRFYSCVEGVIENAFSRVKARYYCLLKKKKKIFHCRIIEILVCCLNSCE